MAKGLDHEKRNRKLSRDDVVERQGINVTTRKLMLTNDNVEQRRWLTELLASPELGDKADIQKSLDWLNEVSTRRLGHGWRAKYRRVESACKLKREGRYTQPSEEKKLEKRVENKRRTVLRAIRNAETKPKAPDWMQDKSLLPKKPPSSRSE